ncbi:MAG: YsnF/AvaK domain-containing protein [Xenococcaceae cyanobacterium]
MLPEYDENMTVDYDYEERVKKVYRGTEYDRSEALDYESEAYYEREPDLYAHSETETNDRQNLKLYEERLVANKERFRAGTVTIGKKVESETANVSVPVEKERIVVERTTPTNAAAVAPGETAFEEGEVARVEVYEETADIKKQAFVRKQVETKMIQVPIRQELLIVEKIGKTPDQIARVVVGEEKVNGFKYKELNNSDRLYTTTTNYLELRTAQELLEAIENLASGSNSKVRLEIVTNYSEHQLKHQDLCDRYNK